MILDLLRHGETELGGGMRGSLDDALTAHGWAQMEAAVADAGPWDVLVCSPLQRCARFADALGARLGVPVLTQAGFRELHFGEWEGRSPADLMHDQAVALGRFWQDPYGYTPPGGEAVAAFAARVQQALAEVRAYYARQRVLLISHGGVMRLLLAQAQGLPREHLLQVQVAHAALLRLDLAAFDAHRRAEAGAH